MSGVARPEVVQVTLHGPAGAMDLVVPAGAVVADLTHQYISDAGVPYPLVLRDPAGRPFPSELTIAAAGVRTGSVLVMTPAAVPPPAEEVRRPAVGAAPVAQAWVGWALAAGAALFALFAAWVAAVAADETVRHVVAGVLAAIAVSALVPAGSHAAARSLAAPAFGGAAAFAVAHQPGAEQTVLSVGAAALAAAAVAACARLALGDPRHVVWMVAGVAWFVLVAVLTISGATPQVTWSLALLAAWAAILLLPRWVVDVPDRLLVDLDRLVVDVWAPRPAGEQEVSPPTAAGVEGLLERGSQLVVAGSVAVMATVVIAAPQMMATASLGVDRWGAAVLLVALAVALLLRARLMRHGVAAGALRLAALVALGCGVVPRLGELSAAALPWAAVLLCLLGVCLVGAAVAIGRDPQSPVWGRRAELLEVVAGVAVIAATVVGSGWFRAVWEFRA